ncbi:MAG TPA: hypothetical protein VM390_01390, partial [Acidimicrobiales bacterium]|nr:hypothetical protein [Acidimicrobiales bacterium]
GGGGATASAAGTGSVASTGTHALRLIALALLLVAAGAHARYWAPRLAWSETAADGRRRRTFPRPAGPRRSPRRPWD